MNARLIITLTTAVLVLLVAAGCEGSDIQVVCSGTCSYPSQQAPLPHAGEQVAFFEVLNGQGQTAVRGGVAVFGGPR